MKACILIDGGTTNLRVFLLDSETGSLLATARRDGGVKHTAIDGNDLHLRTMLRESIREVLDHVGLDHADVVRAVAFGMITSGMGLYEIPHLCAPVTPEQMRAGMRSRLFPDIAPFPIEFIPGLRNFTHAVNTENVCSMDMMRGEETESIGLYHLLGLDGDALFILPGSHNKFVRMGSGSTIQGCMTSISGELLDAVTHHTILAGSVDHRFLAPEDYDSSLVRQGAEECRRSGLGRAAFSGRILQTLGQLSAASIQNYLLGAVLAEDILALSAFTASYGMPPVYVAGKAPVQQAMVDILTHFGFTATPVSPALSSRIGIVGALLVAGYAVDDSFATTP